MPHFSEILKEKFLSGQSNQFVLYGSVQDLYPQASLLGCSTAGEIFDTSVSDDTISATAVLFEHSRIQGRLELIDSAEDSYRVACPCAV